MQDEMIVELFWRRDETALRETENKYKSYLGKVAYNILADIEDAREAVNEALLRAWNSIPPQRPSALRAYLSKLTRELAIDAYRAKHRKKRISSELTVSLEELGEVASGGDSELDLRFLGETIERYLNTLSEEARTAFVQRYYFSDTLHEIAARQNVSESKVKSMLFRVRAGLREFLIKEGYDI